MSTRVLKAFLLGIGWDTSQLEQGDKKIEGSLNKVKSSSLGISAAILGAFGALAANVSKTADRVDTLAARTQNLRTGINTVYGFGNAIRLMGGDASDAVESLSKFEEIQNNLRLKGDAGPIRELAMAGIDTSQLYKTQTGEEFLKVLSDMLPSLDQGQRAVVQNSLGLSDATFRAISGGFNQLSQAMDHANSLTGNVDGLTENSRRLKEVSAELGLSVEGITNELTQKMLPSFIGFGQWATDWLSEHRSDISKAIDVVADNPQASATLLGGAGASAAGALLSRLGLGGLGAAIGATGGLGIVAGAAGLATPYINPAFDALLGVDRTLGTGEAPGGSGTVLRGQAAKEYLDRQRSAGDSLPAMMPDEDVFHLPSQNVDSLVRAIQAAKVNVQNNLTLQLDGRAIEAKVIEVNGRQNYDSMSELQSTTDR